MKRLLLSNTLVCLVLAALIVAGSTLGRGPVESLDRCAYDGAMRLRRASVESPVTLVEIDEESLDRFGPWPWPRSRIARLVDRVSGAGARATGLALLYAAPEENEALLEIRRIRGALEKRKRILKYQTVRGIYEELSKAEKRVDGDAMLQKAVYSASGAVLPFRFETGPEDWETPPPVPIRLTRHSIPWEPPRPDPLVRLRAFRNPAEAYWDFGESGIAVRATHAELASAAGRLGHLNLFPDEDGVLRRETLLFPSYGRLYPSFSLQLVLAQQGERLDRIRVHDEVDGRVGLELAGRFVPTEPGFRLLLDLTGADRQITRVSAGRILAGDLPPEAFRDRPVLIGLTAPGPARRYPTSAGREMTLPEITALSAANLLTGTYFVRPGWAWALETAVILYLALFLVLFIPRISIRVGAAIMAASLLAWVGAVLFLFRVHGYWLRPMPAVVFVLLGLVSSWSRRRSEGAEEDEERIETNKMLGLSFQSQGMLDMAFDKFMKCPVQDESVRKLLYNLGLDFERKRMFDKAVTVYRHILKAGRYRDARERIERLRKAEGNRILGKGGMTPEGTLRLDPGQARPTLGRYEVIKVLGRGAMGTVYLGRDPKINREVAIKTLRYDEIDADQLREVKKRFFREAEAAGKLNHPNIVTIYDVGEDHDMAYMAMELLRGKDLTIHCNKAHLLPVRKTLEIAAGVAEALDYAHKHGVVHRDIKPANIMVLAGGQVKVTDFGIAQVISASKTQTGVVLGTPNYMSPEQVAGKKVDGRSDLFSLGVVMYELLSGQKPFKGENMAALMYNISNTSYPSLLNVAPEVLPCCVDIVERLLSKGLTKRYRTAGELARRLRECLEELDR